MEAAGLAGLRIPHPGLQPLRYLCASRAWCQWQLISHLPTSELFYGCASWLCHPRVGTNAEALPWVLLSVNSRETYFWWEPQARWPELAMHLALSLSSVVVSVVEKSRKNGRHFFAQGSHWAMGKHVAGMWKEEDLRKMSWLRNSDCYVKLRQWGYFWFPEKSLFWRMLQPFSRWRCDIPLFFFLLFYLKKN